MPRHCLIPLLAVAFLLPDPARLAADAEPVAPAATLRAHWPLRADARDAVGSAHGEARNVRFADGAASFNGLDSRIEIADADALDAGTRDFSIALWARCETPMASTLGDLLSKFDAANRRGINLHVAGSSPAYSAMSDTRHVHFGVDDGYVSAWKDHGKPWPSNSLIANLVAYQGELYCGIADAKEPQDRAHVFKLSKDGKWIDCGRLGNDPTHHSVMSMIVHDGKLYAGTGTWDWWEAEGAIKGLPPVARTRVFRYDGGTTWTDTGQLGTGTRVLCLASFKSDLYGGIDDMGGGHAFRYDGKQWHDLGSPDGKNFECFLPLGGTLYASTHGNIYAYAGGQSWKPMGKKPHDINQIHSMQVFGGQILLGTWPQGYVLRHAGEDQWSIIGRLGLPDDPSHKPINEVMDLVVYNGKLYAGMIPHAELYRYESDNKWTMLGSHARRGDWDVANVDTWVRISSMAAQGGRLFAGTGSCRGRAADAAVDDSLGRVFSIQAGTVVSHEHDIGGAWTHLAAIRRGRTMELYVNGKLSTSQDLPAGEAFNLTNAAPLLIGAGAQNSFHGAMRDVRWYDGALAPAAVQTLAATAAAAAAEREYDVVVYGATPAGVAASVAAAREGKSVAVVEPLDIAGGMMSGGLSFSDSNQTARETLGGLFEEFHLRVEKHYADRGIELPYQVAVKDNAHWTYEPHVAEKVFNELLAEAKMTVFLGEQLADAKFDGNAKRIASIRTATGKEFAGKVFVDASYEGDLMAAAGVEYRVGREGRDEHDESLAGAIYPKKPVVDVSALDEHGKPLPLISSTERSPEGQGDKRIMTYSFRFCFSKDPANQVPFTKPADYDPARYELLRRFLIKHPDTPRVIDLYPLPNNKLDGNNGIGLQVSTGLVGESHVYPDASPAEREQIWAAHRSYAEGLFWFLKTDPAVPSKIREQMNALGYAKDEFAKFGHFPPVLYVREARRMVGEYFLTQADIRRNASKPDSIGVGSFPIDSHDCQRIALPDGGFINEGTIFPVRQKDRPIGHVHQLPYRAITPKREQCTNLLVPVCLSASHVAFSSVRVEPTWIVLGQSAGVAAAVAAEDDVAVQDVNYARLAERLIKQKQLLALP